MVSAAKDISFWNDDRNDDLEGIGSTRTALSFVLAFSCLGILCCGVSLGVEVCVYPATGQEHVSEAATWLGLGLGIGMCNATIFFFDFHQLLPVETSYYAVLNAGDFGRGILSVCFSVACCALATHAILRGKTGLTIIPGEYSVFTDANSPININNNCRHAQEGTLGDPLQQSSAWVAYTEQLWRQGNLRCYEILHNMWRKTGQRFVTLTPVFTRGHTEYFPYCMFRFLLTQKHRYP